MTFPTMLSIGTPNSFAHFMQKPRVVFSPFSTLVINTTATRLWHCEHMVMPNNLPFYPLILSIHLPMFSQPKKSEMVASPKNFTSLDAA